MAGKKSQVELERLLLGLGSKTTAALEDSNPEALDLIDQYSDAFESWRASWAVSGAKLSPRDREMGERIALQHAKILELTEGMLRSVEQSLKDLRGWSKGIRAYMDHLPKKVSTIRTRKG
jgi:hypothetical protein